MDINFIKQIEEAEAKAAAIISLAETNAKSKIDQNNQQLQYNLDQQKSALIAKNKEEIASAEKKAASVMEESLKEQTSPVISAEKKAEAIRQTVERIVELLGNS